MKGGSSYLRQSKAMVTGHGRATTCGFQLKSRIYLEPELEPAGKNIVFNVAGIIGEGGVFVIYHIVPQHQLQVFIDIIIISNTPGIVADVAGMYIIAVTTDLAAFYVGVGVVPVVFNTYLVLMVDDILQQVKEGAIELPDII